MPPSWSSLGRKPGDALLFCISAGDSGNPLNGVDRVAGAPPWHLHSEQGAVLASCGQACQRGEGWGYFHFCWTRVTLSVPAPFVLTSALVPLGRVRHPPTKMEANTSLASAPAPVMVLDRPCSCRWTPWAWAQSPIVHPGSRGQGEAELGSMRPQRPALQGHDFWLGWGLKFF